MLSAKRGPRVETGALSRDAVVACPLVRLTVLTSQSRSTPAPLAWYLRLPLSFIKALHSWILDTDSSHSSANMSLVAPTGFQALPLPIAQLSLAAVLKCGQSFRWNIFPLQIPSHTPVHHDHPTHEYRLCLRDRVVCLRQSRDVLFYRSLFSPSVSGDQGQREAETLAWIRDYFQLDIDLVDLYRQWSTADPVFNRIQDRFEGIRMLRQDPFENLIS